MSLKDIFLQGKYNVYKGLNTYFGANLPGGETLQDIVDNEENLKEAIKNPKILELILSLKSSDLQYSKPFVEAIKEAPDGIEGMKNYPSFFSNILLRYPEGREILFNSQKFVDAFMKSSLGSRINTSFLVDELFSIEENRELVKKSENYTKMTSTIGTWEKVYKILAILQDLDFTLYQSYNSNDYKLWKDIADSEKAIDCILNMTTISVNSDTVGYILSSMANKLDSDFPKSITLNSLLDNPPSHKGNMGKILESEDIDILNMVFHPSCYKKVTDSCVYSSYGKGYGGYYGDNLSNILDKKLMPGRRLPLLGYTESANYDTQYHEFVGFISDGISRSKNGSYGGYYWYGGSSSSARIYSMIKTPMLNLTNISRVFLRFTVKALSGKPRVYFGITDNPDITKNMVSSSDYIIQDTKQLNPSDNSLDENSSIIFNFDVTHLKGKYSLVFIHLDDSNNQVYSVYPSIDDYYLEY